ncbi:MAG TPA: hypothetical protein VK215_05240 [Acidimicrobiales bacterium]|nr:hypothetical protein [Acidimicrobiales bacterium]
MESDDLAIHDLRARYGHVVDDGRARAGEYHDEVVRGAPGDGALEHRTEVPPPGTAGRA